MKSLLLAPAFVLGGALFLGACGASPSTSTSSVLDLTSTNYVIQSTTPSTVAPTTDPTGAVAGEQEYTIQSGDVPFTVARKFGVTLEALELANADTPGYSAFYVGLKIRIPAGGVVPDPSANTTLPPTPANTTTTVKGGQSNCQAGSYVIVEGDLPGTVAKKFDVTVAQLDAANANTKGYKNFIVGITIVIPPKTGC
jgi:LysM repeat protein